ncbi:MAG: dethiobiotin synthase [Acidobacteriota bacterium]
MPQTFFITGTDTGVGKTAVTCALVRALRKAGYRARAVKPIESGCVLDSNGELVPADAQAHRRAAGLEHLPLEHFIRYRLQAPLAPAVAAEKEGVTIELSACLALVQAAALETDVLLVEGAGGLLVPLTRGVHKNYQTVADFIALLGVPTLVVARARLGTLNHVLLTWNELRRRRLPCLGVLLNDTDAGAGPERENNARVLQAFGVPVLAELPYDADHLEPYLSDVLRHLTRDPPP